MGRRARRRGRRWLTYALTALALLVPVLVGPSATADPQSPPDLQQQLQQAADDIGVRDAAADRAAAALADIDRQLRAAQAALNDANGQLQRAQDELQRRQSELANAQHEELAAQQRVDDAQQRVDASRGLLRTALRNAFEQGAGDDMDALLGGGTPDELANRLGLLDHVSAARQRQLATLVGERDALDAQRHQLTDARQRALQASTDAANALHTVADIQRRAADEQHRLQDLRQQRQQAADVARQAADDARQRYDQLQAASQRYQQELAGLSGTPVVTLPPTGPAISGTPSAAGLIMPVTGTFSSPFGYRVDPFGLGRSFHPGQDIAAPLGTPIYAATAGVVALVETPDQSGGYGNFTCIDRGGGFATCYAHQSAVFVHVGQVVAQGQEIGLVGSTGASTGPHLHFEVRLNGKPVDPMPYLP